MGCVQCDFTGVVHEYDETAGPGYVDIPCPECIGIDGQEPVWVTDIHDTAIQAETEEAWRQYAEGEPCSKPY